MNTLYSLKSKREVKIIKAILEELKAENQEALLTIRFMDQLMNANCDPTIHEDELTNITRF